MSLKIYHCTECDAEFAMTSGAVEEDEELSCPACGEPADEGPADVDEEEEDTGLSQESNPRGRRNPRRPNPLLRRRR